MRGDVMFAPKQEFLGAPNDLWSADFKGQFRTGDGHECFPLTIADHQTRSLLSGHGVLSTQVVTAGPVFERAFRGYGLPVAIRTDNGVPFATMHRTFRREAIKPVRHTCRQQQRNVDGFQHEYNTERPHEALQQDTPASRYRHSTRSHLDRLPPLEYPGHFLVKKRTTGGTFRFHRSARQKEDCAARVLG